MPSKWKIWDFAKTHSDLMSTSTSCYLLYCYDQYAFKYIKKKLNPGMKVVLGGEIDSHWVDSNLRSLDLFGTQDHYLIHFAEQVPLTLLQEILELNLGEQKIVFNFSKKTEHLRLSNSSLLAIEIQAPAFWEERELLDFVCEQADVYLGFNEKKYIIANVPFQLSSYAQLVDRLKINYPQADISVEQIEENISEPKIDMFELAEKFALKKMQDFYRLLLNLISKEQDLYQVFYFLNSHMQKIYDSSYSDAKKRLSKYDKQIKAQQEIWNQDDASRAISYLSDLLVLYKLDKSQLQNRLRQDYLKVLFV